MSIITVLLILSLLVILHELGHFLVAKWFHVQVEEFGFGYPPKIVDLGVWRQTHFSLNAIPFGGFVRLSGETEAEPTTQVAQKHQFTTQPKGIRLAIIAAGPVVNLVIGSLIFMGVYLYLGIPTPVSNQARIASVVTDSPADHAGLKTDEIILKVVATDASLEKPNISQLQSFFADHQGQTLTISVTAACKVDICDQEDRSLQIYARTAAETPANQGPLGIVLADYYWKRFPLVEMPFRAIYQGISESLILSYTMMSSVITVFYDFFTGKGLNSELAGPVGIVHQAQQQNIWSGGWLMVLNFAALLSINLAVMNILPIPALDGGRLVMIMSEWIFGATKVKKIEPMLTYGSFLFLLVFISLVSIRDVWRIILGN